MNQQTREEIVQFTKKWTWTSCGIMTVLFLLFLTMALFKLTHWIAVGFAAMCFVLLLGVGLYTKNYYKNRWDENDKTG